MALRAAPIISLAGLPCPKGTTYRQRRQMRSGSESHPYLGYNATPWLRRQPPPISKRRADLHLGVRRAVRDEPPRRIAVIIKTAFQIPASAEIDVYLLDRRVRQPRARALFAVVNDPAAETLFAGRAKSVWSRL